MSGLKLFVLVGLLALPAAAASAGDLTIAAASDLQLVFPEVVAAFEKSTGKKVRVSYSSSGNFFAQIQNGAPFDLFFSADVDYPRRLVAAGFAQGEPQVYGIGRIVLWVPKDSKLDLERTGLQAVLSPGVKKVAIANPAHAPYGRAAKAALEKAGLWTHVQPKLVIGENISQAAHFVRSGSADAGIIALALALSDRMKPVGRYWLVPEEMHPRLEQAAVITKAAKDKELAAARQFLTFMRGNDARAIMAKFGFVAPVPEKKAR